MTRFGHQQWGTRAQTDSHFSKKTLDRPGKSKQDKDEEANSWTSEEIKAGRKTLTIHLHQQLVQGLLLLGVGEAGDVGGAFLAHGVDLVDVDDAGSASLRLPEQAPHTGRPQACRERGGTVILQLELSAEMESSIAGPQ